MDLPIDHFRLLGVNTTTDAQAVLHTLQQRLDRAPNQGFSAETLEARAELLRASADLLCDPQRRSAYEASLTTLAAEAPGSGPSLETPPGRELGGLLLLLEAGLAQECFERAERNLQTPQTPPGSARESDLALLAGLSCMAAAADLHKDRRYEPAAQLLIQGKQLLQQRGQQLVLQQQLEHELQGLQPFRVLDLLSRDLVASHERAQGLQLLDGLVQRRGGLEGQADPRLPAEDFQAFFRQIRSFLTVQEQIDLFSHWGQLSDAAHFLATTALTASGFARRKPDQIATALQRLQQGGQGGTEPLQACLQLLLGKVDSALTLFASGASPELRTWAEQQSDDPLAQLCAYCRDWLSRDVLPGYRDLEADPDLEAWFADRDVQQFVEQQDTPPPPPEPRMPSSFFAGLQSGLAQAAGVVISGTASTPAFKDLRIEPAVPFAVEPSLPSTVPTAWDELEPELQEPEAEPEAPAFDPIAWLQGLRAHSRALALAAAVAAVAAGGGALLLRSRQAPPTPIAVQPPTQPAPAPVAPPLPKPQAPAPLTSADPSEAELRALLEAWLAGKAEVLAGRQSAIPLQDIARAAQVSQVEEERQRNASAGQSLRISSRIEALQVEERSPQRIAVVASLDYSDQRLDAAGSAVGQPSTLKLRNRYVFARDGERWLLASYGEAN